MKKISDDAFMEAVNSACSVSSALIILGLVPSGGNYKTFSKRVKKMNINTSHFTGQGWNKGKTHGPKRDLSVYLSNEFPIQSHPLRVRLIKEGIKKHVCEICNNDLWNNLPIPLELDHIDGNHTNNNLSNIRLLCPNCHSQTDTHCGKNTRKAKDKKEIRNKIIRKPNLLKDYIRDKEIYQKTNKEFNYCSCGKLIHKQSTYCHSCSQRAQERIHWPSDKEMFDLVWEKPRVVLSKELNISNEAIGKRLKLRGIPQPPRGYWAKYKVTKNNQKPEWKELDV